MHHMSNFVFVMCPCCLQETCTDTLLETQESIRLFKNVSHCFLLTDFFQSSKGVFQQFPKFLSNATKEQPLVIMLDSLDQLSPLHGAWKLSWFPRKLPAHVKFIVSTLPDQEYKCFPTLKVVCEICIHSNCVSDHFYCQRCGYQMVSGLDTRLRGLGTSPDQRHHLCSVLAYTLRLSSCKLIY